MADTSLNVIQGTNQSLQTRVLDPRLSSIRQRFGRQICFQPSLIALPAVFPVCWVAISRRRFVAAVRRTRWQAEEGWAAVRRQTNKWSRSR